MINKKDIFFTKIDLLTISLEVLALNHLNNNIISDIKVIRNQLKQYKYKKKLNLIKVIEYIQTIRLLTNKYFLSEISFKIIQEYQQNQKCKIAINYTTKFCNIYSQKKKYYKGNKLLYRSYKVDIKKIAIVNLYLIARITKQEGTYLLIKYLYDINKQ